MKKNLLLMLFAVLFGVASMSATQVRIDVDKAANVVATTGSGTTLELSDGMNTVDLSDADNPLTIEPSTGATIVSVIKNDETATPAGDGRYRFAIEAMMIKVTTESAPVQNVSTWINLNIWNAINFTCDGETNVVSEGKYWDFPKGSVVTLAPESGYQIKSVTYRKSAFDDNAAVDNGDGTWTINPGWDYGYVDVVVEELGIHFTVDINVASNVTIVARLDEDLIEGKRKGVTLMGDGPFTGTAPEGTYCLQFWDAYVINSITRIQTDGTETKCVKSDWVGWTSEVAEGDLFIIDAVGPEVDLTFSAGRGMSLKDFVVSSEGKKLDISDENPTAKVRVGEILTMACGNGYTLSSFFDSSKSVKKIADNGNGIVTGMVLKEGAIELYGNAKTGMTIAVDNVDAITVISSAGNGDVVSLSRRGVTTVEAVDNPLKIVANAGYRIVSVLVDGEILKANADGSYIAELVENGSIIVTTAELPKPLMLTFAVTGDTSKLIFIKDGEQVTFAETMEAVSGTEISFTTVEGWLIKNFLVNGVGKINYDEESRTYSFVVRKAGSFSFSVEEWVAAEGNALVTYITDHPYIGAYAYDEKGNNIGSLKNGRIAELKLGTEIRVEINGVSLRFLKSVTVNGKEIEISEDKKSASFKLEGETELRVVSYALCNISGYDTPNKKNHSFLGHIYINEVGESYGKVAVGESFTVLPTPVRGYKFNGFSFVYPDEIKSQIPDEIKESYTITVPEGVTDIIFQGDFVPVDDRPIYTVRGTNALMYNEDGQITVTDAVIAAIEVDGVLYNEYNAYVGEDLQLRALASEFGKDLVVAGYCVYNHYETRQFPEIYNVSDEDADADDVILVAAMVKKADGVENVSIDAELSYDGATQTLTAPTDVRIYTVAGNLVMTAAAGEISMQDLPAGLYIATTGTSTLKIAK